MTKTLRRLWNNLSSIVLSVLLAVAVWIAATLQADPFASQTFALLPVTPLNQPENTILFEGDTATVNVEVRAQQSVLADLSASDFTATMDLSAVPPGVSASVPISVTCSSDAVRIEATDPAQQIVRLEQVAAVALPVQIRVEGQVATGYQATQPTLTPSQVTVQGPIPYLTDVVSVTGLINVDDAREDVVKKVTVVPQNGDGRLVAGVQWSPDQVEVRIGVRRRVGYKPDVEVVPDVRGDPAPGYRRGSVLVEPSTVTLAGPSLVLNDLPGFVRTWPITITETTEVLTERVPLSVPTNVVVVGVNYVTVTVDILPILTSRTIMAVVEPQGLRPGWVAILSPSEVDVVLEGPDARLAVLSPDELQVFVNLFGQGLGVHRVEPVVLAPEGIKVVSVIPETIEVVIQVPTTPSPSPPPAASGPRP